MKKVIFKNAKGEIYYEVRSENPQDLIDVELQAQAAEGAQVSYEIVDISNEIAIEKRKAEYPRMEEFMDAYFDGGQSALDALKAKRLAIKAKYPKV